MTQNIVLCCVLALVAWPVHAAEELRSFDRNRDGEIDQWEYYSGSALIRVEIDRDLDGRVDEWIFDEQGTPSRTEFDTTGNGKATQREFYDAQGQVQRLEVDRDGDEVKEVAPL
jgi:hypothetical protein